MEATDATLCGGGRIERHWLLVLGVLAAVRVAIPLVALAFSGHDLPGLPPYRYRPLNGDSFGFYAAAREFIASIGRVPKPLLLLAVLLVAAATGAAVVLWRRSPGLRWLALLLPAGALSLALTLPVHRMQPPGAAVFGWSLLWSLPMIPIRALGRGPGPDTAFVLGLGLTLAALAVTVVATAFTGLYATGRRSVGALAAALFAVWPLLSAPLAGRSAWENGQWNVDVGLHLYTEPLSSALVVVSVALLLRPATGSVGRSGAGLAIGYATAVKLTNGVVGLVLALLLARRHGLRPAVPYVLGGLVWLPLVLAYWPKGYVGMFDGSTSAVSRPWSPSYIDDAWRHSLLFTPRLLLLLAPLLVVGCVAVRDRWLLAVVGSPILVNAVVYSFYYVTAEHPRFLYSTLPFVFVLEAAGAVAVARRIGPARGRRVDVRVL
jgi:hypothetical protein